MNDFTRETLQGRKKVGFEMKRLYQFSALLLSLGASLPASAQSADDTATSTDDTPALGMSPGAPQTSALPGGMTPAYGSRPKDAQDWRFDFHGYLQVPLVAGINTRSNPGPDQNKLVLHAPPVVPDDLVSFSHTSVVPTPYTQLNFTYGTSIVTGTVSILATSVSLASSFFDPQQQAGINDVYLTFNLPGLVKSARFEVNVGAFTNRYGAMGEYDEGRYGTPMIARTNGAGENALGRFAIGDAVLQVEQGFQGQSDKAPNGLVPDGWNGFGDPNVGTSFVTHGHLGLGYKGIGNLAVHYLLAWTADDRANPTPLQPDGRIAITGADLRLSMGRFGHLFLGGSFVGAKNARSVGRIVQVLNTNGGPGLMQEYLGPDSHGSGDMTILAAQYDLSLARIVRYPEPFAGDAPDVYLSLFGMQTTVNSSENSYDMTKRKFGALGTYSLLPWLATTIRYDHVVPQVGKDSRSFAVVTPGIIFRSGWQAHDQIAIQYSHWFDGSLTTVRSGYPAMDDPSVVPDKDAISVSGAFWW